MGRKRYLPVSIGHAAAGVLSLVLLTGHGTGAFASGQALVIGEASYSNLPALPGCAVSAHAVAAALRGLGFTVDAQDDTSSGALYAALGALTRQLTATPRTAAVIYICGYATAFEDRPFVLPVSASISRPADVLSQGVLAKTLLNAVTGGTPAAPVLIINSVPMPAGPSVLPLDALVQPGLPETLGYIAASTSAPASTPTPLAAALVSLMHGPTVESAALLTGAKARLAGLNTTTVAAFRAPEPGVYLAGAPAPPAAVPPPPAAASPAAPTATPPATLPSEDQMTEDQRRLVQSALAHLGYYDAKADGIFGPETRAAIRRWQHEVHAPMTGHLTAEEASKLGSSWD